MVGGRIIGGSPPGAGEPGRVGNEVTAMSSGITISGLTPGQTYTVIASVWVEPGVTVALTATGTSATPMPPAQSWQEPYLTFLASAATADVTLTKVDGWGRAYMGVLLIAEGEYAGTYFDGDTSGAWWGGGAWEEVTDKVATSAKSTADAVTNLTDGWKTTGTTTIDGGKITADSVKAAQIAAGTITGDSAIIGNLAITDRMVAAGIDGGKITANSIDAIRLKANSIGVEQLIVSDVSNMATINETFEGSAPDHIIVDGWSARNPAAKASNLFQFRPNSGPVPFRLGDRIRLTMDIRTDEVVPWATNAYILVHGLDVGGQEGGGGSTQPGLIDLGPIGFEEDNQTEGGTTWEARASGEADVDFDVSGATSFELYLEGGIANEDVRVRGVRAYLMNAGELIVDGSITALMLNAEEVWANELWVEQATTEVLTAGVIEADMISSGARNDLLIDVRGELNIIASGLDTLEGNLEDTDETVDEMAKYYDFTAEGLIISDPGSVYGMRLGNDAIEMLQNDEVVSYWKGQKMFVSDMEVTKIQMANHQLETYGAGTVVKAI